MNRKILVHTCCAPCFAAPYFQLKDQGWKVHGFWYNPNIHPYTEYSKRLETLTEFVRKEKIDLIVKDDYDLEDFLRKSAYRESNRCHQCYYDRLKHTAAIAKKGQFDAFTSTLLYSKYQKHDLIKKIAETLAEEYGVEFYYADFREFWKEGIELSKQFGMYRQQYCGCIYSEKERYLGVKSKKVE